jgi:cell division protein FtsI (penicillin-binding protein 3)
MIVVIDGPRRKGYYGGAVAAPVFKRIAEATLRHLAIPPNVDRRAPVVVASKPPTGRLAPVAVSVLHPQSPQSVAADTAPGRMPDLSGLSARQVVRLLGERGLEARVTGHGFVIAQSIAPDAEVMPGDLCTVRLARDQPPGEQEASR